MVGLGGKIDLEVFKIGRFIMMAWLQRDLIMGGRILVSIVSYNLQDQPDGSGSISRGSLFLHFSTFLILFSVLFTSSLTMSLSLNRIRDTATVLHRIRLMATASQARFLLILQRERPR